MYSIVSAGVYLCGFADINDAVTIQGGQVVVHDCAIVPKHEAKRLENEGKIQMVYFEGEVGSLDLRKGHGRPQDRYRFENVAHYDIIPGEYIFGVDDFMAIGGVCIMDLPTYFRLLPQKYED